MAKPTGLSFENPMYQDASGVPSAVVNPFGFQNAAAASGSDALRDDLSSLAMMGGMGVQLARQNQFTMPEMKQPPSIGYSPSRKEIFVQGTTFAADDAQSILQAEGLLGGSPTGLPTEGDWVPLDVQSYGQLVKSVRQPTFGTLAAKNFGRGVDAIQMLAGRGLQLAGAEELGGRIVSQQMQDLAKTAPYERQFTDIESGRGAVEWLVANFAQQGPNMIESIATAGLGFLAGTASSGTPIGGAAAAFSSLLGKSAWKESVKAALAKQARGEALNTAQQKLLREAAGIAGAVTASYAQNLATGAADIYGELREQGADANDVNARLTALAGAVPYAALETLPEFLLAGRVLTGVGAPTPMGVGITARQRGKELLKRGAVGGAVGGLAEGTTELSQEALLLGLSDQDFGSPENVDRLINSFAAGFGIGGPVGAAANLRGREATNLLNTAQSAEPTPGTGLVPVQPIPPAPTAGGPGTAVEPYYTPATFAGVMPTPPAQLAGPTTVPQLPGPVQPVTPMGEPYYAITPEGAVYQDVMLRQQGNVPPGAPGTQGVLDVFGGQISAQELAARMQPPAVQPELPALPAPPAAVSPAQGALQFAGPAPAAGPVNTQMANQLQAIQARGQRQREFEAAQAQQQAAIQQQMDILAQQSQNARDLYAMQQAQQAAAVQPTMPMRETGPVAPRQLELFTRRQAPRPSRAEGLRRGVGTQVPPVTGETPLTPAQQRAQLSLFTREGQPTVAALKAAGVKTKVVPAPAKAPVVKPRTQRGLKKQAGVAAVEIVPKGKSAAVKLYRGVPAGQEGRQTVGNALFMTPNRDVAQTYAGDAGTVTEVTQAFSNLLDVPTWFAAKQQLGLPASATMEDVVVAARAAGYDGVSFTTTNGKEYIVIGELTEKEKPSAAQKGKFKQGRVEQRAKDNEGVRAGRNAGQQPTTQVPASRAEAGGRGVALKRGAQPEKVTKEKSERQRRIKFAEAISAVTRTGWSLFGRVNTAAQKAAVQGNFQGVLTALEKSKNNVVAEIARRAKTLNTKIVIDDDAQETYSVSENISRQNSIDSAKTHLAALEELRSLVERTKGYQEQVELPFSMYLVPTYSNGKATSTTSLRDLAKMGHTMFAPLPFGPMKVETKADLVKLLNEFEQVTNSYGEDALRLTATASADVIGVIGAYDAKTDTIRVPEYFAKDEVTLAHEIVHAQTVATIANPDARQKPVVAKLNKLFEYVKERIETEGKTKARFTPPYGATNLQEFIAEGMGNPNFQFILNEIPYENTSAWSKFVQLIADLLGIKEGTAFTELLSLYDDLIISGVEVPKRAEPSKAETLKRGKTKEVALPKKPEAVPAAPAPAKVEALPPAEAWEDMKPEGAPAFSDLPPAVRTQWAKDVTAGKATIPRAKDILGDTEETPLQLVNNDFTAAEESTDIRDFAGAISTVVEYAYFTSEETNTKAAVMRARELLANTAFTDAQQNAIDTAVIEAANTLPAVEAVYTRGALKGNPKPWFDYAVQRGLLPQVTTRVTGLPLDAAQEFLTTGQLRTANLPEDTVRKIKSRAPEAAPGKANADLSNDTRANPASALANEIKKINSHTGMSYSPTARNNAIKRLRELWTAVQAAGMQDFIDQSGVPLSDYFDDEGNPYTGRVKGQFRVATEEITAEVRTKRETLIDEGTMAEDDVYESPFNLDSWNISAPDDSYGDGRYFRDDGTPITKAIPMGRIKILVSTFLNKLGVKPNVFIYRDQADFKAKNPSLYAKAVASRPQGDFDTASAVGYSFGDGNVIIFSNRVATEQQLKFVLAHETLGHFGFRGLMTERELNVALDAVYNSSAKVRNAVETAMQARGMSKREAVEEYLADFAGTLDTNIIAKFWNAIKNALNKLGVRFDDDMARYLVSQSRRYVRNGAPSSSFVDFKAMAQRIAAIEGIDDPDGSGRFSVNAEYYDEQNRVLGQTAFGRRSFKLFDVTEMLQRAKDNGVNIKDYYDRFIGELKTMNFASRENLGYRALYELYRDTSKKASQLRAQYNKLMETVLSPAVELPGIGKVGEGATEEQIAQTSRMLRAVNSARFATLSDAELRRMGALIKIVDGKAQIDQDVYKALDARGRATLDEFKKGFSYTDYVSRPATEEYRDTLRAERDALLAAAVDAKDRDNITKEYDAKLKEPSMSVAVTRTFEAMPDLTEKSLEWIMYNEVRAAMNQSAVDLLLSNFTAAREMRVNVERKAAHFLDKVLSEQDKAFLGRVADKFLDLYNTGAKTDDSGVTRFDRDAMRNAEKFIAEFNTALLGRGTDLNKNVQEFFDAAEADDVFNGIEALKAGAKIKRDSKETKFMVQQAIANLATSEERRSGAEVFAKQTIAGGYVPFGREGSWQVRVQAVDPKTGRIYKVADEYRDRLFFAQVANKAEALQIAEDAQRLFDSVKDGVEMEVFDGNEYVIKRVKLRAQPETARETVSTTSEANLNEIIAAITRFSISITPEERERLVQGLTRQNSNARSRLRRAGTPGEDPNTIKYVSKHLESTAATVARKENRHRLDRLFDEADPDSKALWYGDEVEYNRRKAAWEAARKDPNMPEAQRLAAKREYEDYHYTFITKDSQEQGNRYKDRGRRLVAFMESQTDVDHTDFASGEVASLLRSGTTFAFMGASFATAILNYLSLATNVLPAFSGYNQDNAFGGGFGWGQSSVELTRATKDAAGFGQSEAKFWDDLLADPAKLKASGFTEVEARFMQKEVSGGTMQAALTNSLLGSARGKFTSGAAKKAAETWMSLFNYTEQHSRRATGLAAFRMAYARALREGKDAATAFEVADKFAVDMIDNTLGEYAMYNRPAMFRGDVRQFLFMYKMFPVNTIQMLKALPRQEQLLALGILAMFAGLKGLPFAEDLMDLIDTVFQGLGLGPSALWKGSAERTLAEALDAVAPGMTPVLMKGLLNVITPANWADRVSLGNIAPGSAIALAGADVGRELIEIMGPMASFLQGAVVTSADIAKYGLETVGALPDTTSINGILRESPVAMLRALGDMWAYNNAGAIVSQKGYVVSEDLHLGTMLTRALGFYPAAATAENDVVRLAKRVGDYQKDIAATYRGMYISAKIAKDNERAREVVQMVRDWNENAKGTGLELRNFEAGANRALREAQRPATERFLRTQPLAVRPATEEMLRMYGVGEE